MCAGVAVWLYTLLLPTLATAGSIPISPLGTVRHRSAAAAGSSWACTASTVSHAVVWSLGFNFPMSSCPCSDGKAWRNAARRHSSSTRSQGVPAPIGGGCGAGPPRCPRGLLIRFLGRVARRSRSPPMPAGKVCRRREPDGGRGAGALRREAAGGRHRRGIGAGDGGLGGARRGDRHGRSHEHPRRDLPGHRVQPPAGAEIPGLEEATTELRAANERLRELDRLKDDFISTVTHELRTPLTSIRSFSEILRDNPDLDVGERSRFLTIVIKESERLTRLINELLDLAKIESGKTEWNMVDVDLREVVEESVAATSQLYRDRQIALDLDLPPAVTPILADRDRLVQVMINLLSNACKFCSREAGRVRIVLSQERGYLRVDVADNGLGISAGDHEIIFEKFRQVSDTLTDKPQGTGLGLPICRQIVGRCGGRLWVESELGSGATFSFTLPLTEKQPQEAGTQSMAHA